MEHKEYQYYYWGSIKHEAWYNEEHKLHRDNNLPAAIMYHENGQILEETYYINGKRCRTDNGPVTKYYHISGKLKRETWESHDGLLHRVDGPALIQYDKNGNIFSEIWCINGLPHRTDGPAFSEYNKNGATIDKKYWWNDHQITDFVKNIIGDVPDELTKGEQVLLKLSLPDEVLLDNTSVP